MNIQNLPEPAIIDELGPLLVVNKPGGLLTQAPPGIDSLESRIKQFLKIRDSKPGNAYLGVPHRLDRPASGVMVFAKHVRAARNLASQFQQRSVVKKYWAVVEGRIENDAGTWTDWMRKKPDEAKSEICEFDGVDAKQAVLHFKILARNQTQTWMQIGLETGRTHQIRLQCASRGFPIVGDHLYGGRMDFGVSTPDFRKRWIALHAHSIELTHPMTQKVVHRKAAVWEAWRSLNFEFEKYDES